MLPFCNNHLDTLITYVLRDDAYNVSVSDPSHNTWLYVCPFLDVSCYFETEKVIITGKGYCVSIFNWCIFTPFNH